MGKKSIDTIKTSAIAQKNGAFDDYRWRCTYIELMAFGQRILQPYIREHRHKEHDDYMSLGRARVADRCLSIWQLLQHDSKADQINQSHKSSLQGRKALPES